MPMDFWDVLLAGGALMMIFEGIMPFIAPAKWRETMLQAMKLSDGQLRFFGFSAMMIGLMLLTLLY